MNSSNVELSTILDRIIDKAADNLRFAKILVQLGLDPDNVTYNAIFNRLLEIFLANITIANICALIGATFFVATLLPRSRRQLIEKLFCLLQIASVKSFGEPAVNWAAAI